MSTYVRWSITFSEDLSEPRTPNIIQMGFSEKSKNNVPERTRHLQKTRLQHLHRACSDKGVFKNAMYKGESHIKFFYSSKYNFSSCKVPKVGCSFWTQLLAILKNGANASDEVFGMKRSAVHAKLGGTVDVSFEGDTRHNSPTVLVSRNPYSRLFSAFIDKMFLPLKPGTAVDIIRRQRDVPNTNVSCANDITFQEFLKDIIDSAEKGKSLNRHWAPIFSLCFPCEVNGLALVKLETYSADVEYILKKVGVAKEEFEVIYAALHNHRIETTIPGIVATVAGRGNSVKQCMDKIEVARRIWVSFQIQGYIKGDIPFPTATIDTNEKAKDSGFLTHVILETINKHPMSPDEAKIQRQQALVKAFEGVSKYTLDKVRELYKQDFILYDYSFELPSM